jgi:thymidine phosphorylase
VRLTRAFGRRAVALVTDMDEPLGSAIGSGLEAIAARDFLRGSRRDARLGEVCEALGVAMLEIARGDAAPDRPTRDLLRDVLDSGRAYETFERMVAAQGARPGALDAMRPHREQTSVRATRTGFVTAIDAVALGEAARELIVRSGPFAGLEVRARTGTAVRAGDELVRVYGDARESAGIAGAFALGEEAPPARPVVYFETGSASAGERTSDSVGMPRSTLESR